MIPTYQDGPRSQLVSSPAEGPADQGRQCVIREEGRWCWCWGQRTGSAENTYKYYNIHLRRMGQLLHTPVNATLECLTPFHVARVVCSRRETKHRTNDRTSRNNTLASRCQISSATLDPCAQALCPQQGCCDPCTALRALSRPRRSPHTHHIECSPPSPSLSPLLAPCWDLPSSVSFFPNPSPVCLGWNLRPSLASPPTVSTVAGNRPSLREKSSPRCSLRVEPWRCLPS